MQCQIRLNESCQFKYQVIDSQTTLDQLLEASVNETEDEKLSDCFVEYLDFFNEPEAITTSPVNEISFENPSEYQDNSDNNCCPICDKHFKEKRNIKIHIKRVHENQKNYKCDLCNYRCYRKFEMLLHHRNIHSKEFLDTKVLCTECGRTMRNNSDLRRHQQKQHLKIKRFKCESCDFTSFEKSATILHGRTHLSFKNRDFFPCDHCGKVLSTKNTLKYHISSVHKKVKPHICIVCSKSFSQKSGLTLHQKTVHQGARDHQCDICKIFVSQASYLKKHKRMMHPEDGHRIKFPCVTCQQTFSTQQALKNHQRIHRDPEFECDQCFKMFYRKVNLQNHQEHHQILDFPCEHCTRSFRKESQLTNHLKKVHFKEKTTFQCELCQSTLTRRTTYRDHVIRQHKELEIDIRDQLLEKITKLQPKEKLKEMIEEKEVTESTSQSYVFQLTSFPDNPQNG